MRSNHFAVSGWALVLGIVCHQGVCLADESALELFKSRITPILRSPNPSSCSECHLSGVDLKNYIGNTQEETFAALVSAGLIDREQPDSSKLLEFIQRAPDDPTPVTADARRKEFEAFRAWIRLAVADPSLAAAKTDDDQLGPTVPVEVIRHGRRDRVLASFTENVWSEIGRCVNCHSPELNRWSIGRDGRSKADVDAISWVAPRDPARTLQNLRESDNIDPDEPQESPLVKKPVGLEEHGGGQKFPLGSRTDKNFRRFLEDYAAVVKGKYKTAADLPEPSAEVSFLTQQQMRLVGLPAGLDEHLLRVDLYRWTDGRWSQDRWATGEGPIAKEQRLWQNMISAVAPRESDRAKELNEDYLVPAGRYLVKIYIDRENKVHADRDYSLTEREFIRAIEIDGDWPAGYMPPKVVELP